MFSEDRSSAQSPLLKTDTQSYYSSQSASSFGGSEAAQSKQSAVVDIPAAVNAVSDDEEARLDILKNLLKQSWPLMLRGAVVAARYFACAVMLAKTDEQLLAPNTLINAMESIYIIFGGRSLAIVSSEISKLYGEMVKARKDQLREGASPEQLAAAGVTIANNVEKIGIVLRHGALLAGAISLPIAGLYYFANHHMLRLLGQHHFAVEKAQDYFQAAALGYVALNFLTAQQRLLQGLQEPIPVLLSNAMHSGLCVLFSYLFLFGKLGFPQLEMAGVGYAFAIAGVATVLANTVYLAFKESVQPYHVFSLQGGFQWPVLRDLAKKGLQTGLQNTTENIANMINSLFLGLHNLTALSADQMAMNVALFISITSGGLAQAISVCVGKALGEKKYQTLKQYGNTGIVLGMVFPVAAFMTLLAARTQFISLFVNVNNPDNAELVRLASSFLLLECLRQLTTAIQLTTATGGLLGLKDTAFTMKTSIGCSLALNAGLLAFFHFVLNANSLVLFSSKAIGMGITALLNTGRWVVVSHEQSPQERASVKDTRMCYRVGRSLRMFVTGEKDAPEHYQPILDKGFFV